MAKREFNQRLAGTIFAGILGLSAHAHAAPWSGRLNGNSAYIYDVSQPVRVAIINNMSTPLPDDDREMVTLARHTNAMLIDVNLDWRTPDESAQRVLDALKAGSKTFPDHPEIQNLNVVLMGFSAGAAGAAVAASSPLLSNPDPTQAPQRVLAVATFDELDFDPYLPPPWVPHLFLSDPGDFYGGLLSNVEDLTPPMSHDAFARSLAAQGRPITVVSQPGDWHGGSNYGWQHRISARFMRIWMDDILNRALPATPPMTAPVLAPDWRTNAGAWRAAYDVVRNTNTSPWGADEHMVNVVIAPKSTYQDPRPYIWLPSQKTANIWNGYATTGTLPAEGATAPFQSLIPFIRPNADATSRSGIDSPVTTANGTTPAVPGYTSNCGFSASGDANLIINFDRAVVSADAVATGGFLAGAPRAWSNVLIVPLKRSVFSPSIAIQLTNIKPADGGAPLDIAVTAKYAAPCP
ncbi:hypothetical protein Msil_2405 [Methylocella silvestris BL2]|uniref:Alpha/beta hydrolase n=1 Tax=Methylocella silvestris (strain DSM 15510 / CIP 108128 / LMG 27833 / NCIMB 13906 / BL2) TaxID=395965 RepID=B8EKG5_METSB|nr:hypothetical protein [Methylocella silvestris]ACK51335.1 hypothetical protein Msil_2405 [Methylocella silvestris BL2]